MQHHESANQPRATPTIIEKPWGQQNIGATYPEASIPPADYQFHLPDRDHVLVEQGSKALEIRYVFLYFLMISYALSHPFLGAG
jgi:hypothetical protein